LLRAAFATSVTDLYQLCSLENVPLPTPVIGKLFYLSLFFKRHRAEYYRLLGEVRRSGDWEAWMGCAYLEKLRVGTEADL